MRRSQGATNTSLSSSAFPSPLSYTSLPLKRSRCVDNGPILCGLESGNSSKKRRWSPQIIFLGRPTLVGKDLSFTHEFSYFLNYQFTVVSSHAVDGHHFAKYFLGSFVGKTSTIGREIWPTPLLIFTGGQKC